MNSETEMFANCPYAEQGLTHQRNISSLRFDFVGRFPMTRKYARTIPNKVVKAVKRASNDKHSRVNIRSTDLQTLERTTQEGQRLMPHILNQNANIILIPGNLRDLTALVGIGCVRERQHFKIRARVTNGSDTRNLILISFPRSDTIINPSMLGKFPFAYHFGRPRRSYEYALLQHGPRRLHNLGRPRKRRLQPICSLRELYQLPSRPWSTYHAKALHPFRIM